MEPSNSPGRQTSAGTPDRAIQSRRKFLQVAGIAGVLTTAAVACRREILGPGGSKLAGTGKTVHLGSGNIGILNYAYALEQLEAAFYITVLTLPYPGMNAFERSMLEDIRDHEIAHREFFKTALGKSAIPELTPIFSSINFSSRVSVLGASKTFEDLGVSAYNGAGSLITSPDYLTLAGKIVSVEARHAAFIRSLISEGSFADSTVIDANGLETSRTPAQVLQLAGAFFVEALDASQLPTS